MATKQVQLRSAIAAALVAASVLAKERIHEDRGFQLASGVDKQLHVNFVQSAPEDAVMFSSHPISWVSEFEVVVLARRSPGGIEAADVADTVWAAAFAALMADQTIGGQADYFEPGAAVVEHGEGDTSLCRLTWTLTVHHRTANNVIT